MIPVGSGVFYYNWMFGALMVALLALVALFSSRSSRDDDFYTGAAFIILLFLWVFNPIPLSVDYVSVQQGEIVENVEVEEVSGGHDYHSLVVRVSSEEVDTVALTTNDGRLLDKSSFEDGVQKSNIGMGNYIDSKRPESITAISSNSSGDVINKANLKFSYSEKQKKAGLFYSMLSNF